jgi:hypothetical protein
LSSAGAAITDTRRYNTIIGAGEGIWREAIR